jgi:hypothetical protein
MASISIPWRDGPGNIVLTYTGQGNGTVVVTSDADNLDGRSRQQTVTFVVTDGAIRNEVTTASSHLIRTSDGNTVRSLDNTMKVTVTVIQQKSSLKVVLTASDHLVCTASGNIVRCNTPN